jgi:DNA repair exonuclease SbcCD ATPase subunit
MQSRLALIEQLEDEMGVLDEAARTLKAAVSAAEVGVRFAALWRAAVPGEACPHGLDAPLETERLMTQRDRLLSLCDKKKRAGDAADQTAAAKESADATIRALLSPMPRAPEDGARALLWLTEQRRLLLDCAERYEQKKKELAALRDRYDTEGETHRKALALLESADGDELLARRNALLSRRELWSQTLLREQQSAERLSAEADELDGLENERARRLSMLNEQKNNLDAILKAEEFLKQARENLSGRYLDTIRSRFGDYMAKLTCKDDPTFAMDGPFHVKIRAAGAGRDSESFSVGVRELISLCERFSLIDVMFEGERPFLVLDDPFTNLDDDTIAHAEELLRAVAQRYQILYLTCHSGRVIHESFAN